MKDLAGKKIALNPNLTPDHYGAARSLIERYIDVFARDSEDLEEARVPPCSFEMRSEEPITMPPYKLSKIEREEMDRQINKLEKVGVIEKSRTYFLALAFLVKKPGNKFRLVVNYSKVNSAIVLMDSLWLGLTRFWIRLSHQSTFVQ